MEDGSLKIIRDVGILEYEAEVLCFIGYDYALTRPAESLRFFQESVILSE